MEKSNPSSYFVISLDFELFWGMFDKTTIEEYGENVAGERTAIPRLLSLFQEYEIHATWATVGMLMARNTEELQQVCPRENERPHYPNTRMSAYSYLTTAHIGNTEADDVYHFGHSLVSKIQGTPHQEIGNHTFSHYYCLDTTSPPTVAFRADLLAYKAIAETYDIEATSIVFPRNQIQNESLRIAKECGMRAYRGTENHILYKSRTDTDNKTFIRALRLLDHYIPISGHHTYPLPKTRDGYPLNIPASRFFRPWSQRLRIFEPLRLRRIKRAMTHAAKNGEIFHLWWHPHNFGVNQDENFRNLQEIFEHFKTLRRTYPMHSASMSDITTISDAQRQQDQRGV